MDLTFFIKNKSQIEVAEKRGLYLVMQSHVPVQFQAYRAGLAGRDVDDPAYRSTEGNFAARFAGYLSSGWLPTDGKVFACLTVKRGRVVEPKSTKEGYRRMDDARLLIAVLEQRYHAKLVALGAKRLGMPGTAENRIKGEFFKVPFQNALKALKSIGQGDFYRFYNNNISSITKQTLSREEEDETEQIPRRESPRLLVNNETANAIQNGDKGLARSMEKVGGMTVRKSPRLAKKPIVFAASSSGYETLKNGKGLDLLRRMSKRIAAQ